ncbi:hypothetical protein [Oceanivirga salmonicida]|uniref:hypothetical protein n=1 Tax=Oceanivirga salmonicida TaxID=1769291 RepID=UPI00082C81F7|nr:hypothetical protein [Oceanivirga salmonicida]
MKKNIILMFSILVLSGLSYTKKPDNINVIGNIGFNSYILEPTYGATLGFNIQPEWIFEKEKIDIGVGPVFGVDTSAFKFNNDFSGSAQINLGVRYDIYLKKNDIYIGSELGLALGIQKSKDKRVEFNPFAINAKLLHVGKKFDNGFRVGGYLGYGSKGIVGLEIGKSF